MEVFLSWIKWTVMSGILPEGSLEFWYSFLEASAPRMSLWSGPVWSDGPVLVSLVPVGLVPVGSVLGDLISRWLESPPPGREISSRRFELISQDLQ